MPIIVQSKILLVTNDASEESHTVHILSKYHFANLVIRLQTAKEASKYFAAFQSSEPNSEEDFPEMIILSFGMGVTESHNLVLQSREGSLKHIPLIVVAGNREEEEAFRKLDLPRTFCITKPIGFFKILEAMQKLGMYWIALRSAP